MKKNILLVTTAIEKTWGSSEKILFLGEWCKLYHRRHLWSQRTSETLPFHWDDRGKLRKDYDYLDSLHRRLLDSLVSALNKFHQTSYSVRYWQLLIDPWLMSYVAVIF